MKKITNNFYYLVTLMLACCFLLMQQYVFAQDTTLATTSTTTTTSTTSSEWYMQPWAWIVGGLIVLLILIGLFSGGNKSKTERVIVTKTVTHEND